jgi:hypothetical protein
MFSEARKLHLIEEVLKINNERTLTALENFIKKSPQNTDLTGTSFMKFAGIWSEEEAAEIERAIEEGCEQINPDDWK